MHATYARAAVCMAIALPLTDRPPALLSMHAPPRAAARMLARARSAEIGKSRLERRGRLIGDIEKSPTPRQPDGPPESDPCTPLALAAVRAGDARKAKEVVALRVAHLTSAANYIVNMEGGSKAQIGAIVDNIQREVSDQFDLKCIREGKAASGWVCLDFDQVIINVFSAREREFYQMEKFWGAAQILDLSGVLVPEAPPSADDAPSADVDVGLDGWADEDDDWVLTAEELGGVDLGAGDAVRDAGDREEGAGDGWGWDVSQWGGDEGGAAAEVEVAEEEVVEEEGDWSLGDARLKAMIEGVEAKLDVEEEDEVDPPGA